MKLKRKIVFPVFVTLLYPAAIGCGVQGKWSLAGVEPTAATRDFQYHSLTLQKDGTFYAEAGAGPIHTTSGTYSYEEGTLDLVEHNGVRHTYDAKIEDGGNKLSLAQFWEGQRLVALMERKE